MFRLFIGVVGGLGYGWAKLNVVFLCRQVRWKNTTFNFAKRWHFHPLSARMLIVALSPNNEA